MEPAALLAASLKSKKPKLTRFDADVADARCLFKEMSLYVGSSSPYSILLTPDFDGKPPRSFERDKCQYRFDPGFLPNPEWQPPSASSKRNGVISAAISH